MSQSAAQKALGIQEILENILIHLGLLHQEESRPPPVLPEPMVDGFYPGHPTPYVCPHVLEVVPVWQLFVLQRVNRDFMASVRDSVHLRRMMRLLPVSSVETKCAPSLLIFTVLDEKQVLDPSECGGKLEFMSFGCTVSGWSRWATAAIRTLQLIPSMSSRESRSRIRICNTERKTTVHVMVHMGLEEGIHYSEEWDFGVDATLCDFHARWLKVGSRSVEEHSAACAKEPVREWQPRKRRPSDDLW